MRVLRLICLLPLVSTLWCCTSKQFDSSNGIDDTCNFYDSVRIMFDPHTEVLDISHLFFSAEINGVKVDSAVIDNGFYYSAMSPDLKRLIKTSFSFLYSCPAPSIWETCLADSLFFKLGGNTLFKVDTVQITDWSQKIVDKSCKVVLGRDFFEKYVVRFDFINSIMTWGNDLPSDTEQYLAIPMHYTEEYPYYDHLYRHIKVPGFRLKAGGSIEARAFLDLGWCGYTGFDSTFLHKVDQHFSQVDTNSLAWLILNQIGVAVDSVDFPIRHWDDINHSYFNVPGCMENLSFCDIMLGLDFFRHFNVIFDYKNNMLYLKRNEQ